MKKTTVHMIGNAHIDPAWLWRWQEGVSEVLASCRSALDRMDENPDFTFSRSSSISYKWIEETSPEVFEEIKRRVAEGRWQVVNGWVEQPDCNIPSGESFVRHALYGKRYLQDKFGVDVVVGWNVDSFGHSAGLPQILAKSGFKYYVFFRPGPHEKELPEPLFCWEGPDGSRILACRPDGYYNTWSDELIDRIERAEKWTPEGLTNSICFYGVGNHGGGPTKLNMQRIREVQEDPTKPNAIYSTPERFFESVLAERTDFPVVSEDLQHHAVGCYSAHSGIKRDNRRCELLLGVAEKFATIAKLEHKRDYPLEAFGKAWEAVLFNQFHDILAGSSCPEVYEDARDTHGFAAWTAANVLDDTLQSIAEKIDTSRFQAPILVFNPLPWTVKQPISYTSKAENLLDENGNMVATQQDLLMPSRTYFGKPRVFTAELPSLGWRVFDASSEGGEVESGKPLSTGDGFIENEWWRIEFDGASVSRIFDKKRGVEVLKGKIDAVVIEDKSDTWAHRVKSFDNEVGRFSGSSKLMENGPVRASVRLTGEFGDSTVIHDVVLYRDLDIIECCTRVDWHEKQKLMKICVPTNVENPSAACGAAYAFAKVDTEGNENPFQQWIDVSGESGGVAMLCQTKYGYDVTGSEIRLTAVRGSLYGSDDLVQAEPGGLYDWLDQGVQEIVWRLVPHKGNWQDAGILRLAEEFACRPEVIASSSHSGEMPATGSFGSVDKENVILGALKMAEDGSGVIVRLYESKGKPTDATFMLGNIKTTVSIAPYELKTMKIAGDGTVSEVDLIERAI